MARRPRERAAQRVLRLGEGVRAEVVRPVLPVAVDGERDGRAPEVVAVGAVEGQGRGRVGVAGGLVGGGGGGGGEEAF